ncbi:pyruvate kinase [Lutibaculum baratangense]|uniref:Pyruvate kinase n=1 Tax=Lutibaculum baratangense AMV1 TaxID=631454 RepID=V4RA97_9HYPH|nr:pyruvate kinase [Lutibaculum baratangense]ESR23101.1 Pyruvate kinase [Lutibaculum baratangense AMV1]
MRARRTKIVATLGPASQSREMLERLFDAGVDVFRINMSHTSHEFLRELHGRIRAVEHAKNRPIGILADLQGPKLRLGTFASGETVLEVGQTFRLDQSEEPGDNSRVGVPMRAIFDALEVGHMVLLNDGRVRIEVTETGPDHVEGIVRVGGRISDRKGINLPDTVLPIPALTEKDRNDLEAALNIGVDWIALSFVQRPEDVAEARKITRGRASIMVKMEKPAAIERLDEILELSDSLMVARGDLGVELPLERVPGLQKRLTRACRYAGKPVVVATQMLESMISAPVPTRAEVSDVATAVFEGADAVMLSAESAVGEFPVEAVTMMDSIARHVESDANYRGIIHAQRATPEATGADAISAAARSAAETLNLAAVVCWTSSGATALRSARERPLRAIVALTPNVSTARRLAVVWGVHCVLTDDARDESDMVRRACRILFQEKVARIGDRVIIMAGVPFGTPGATNMLRIAFVGDEDIGD